MEFFSSNDGDMELGGNRCIRSGYRSRRTEPVGDMI